MASEMECKLLSLATKEHVHQCADSLLHNRYALSRMLVDSKQRSPLPQLVYTLVANKLLGKEVVLPSLAPKYTDEERCSNFFWHIEEEIRNISDVETGRKYIVKLLKTFVDNDLRDIALSIHYNLSLAIIEEVDGNSSPASPSADLMAGRSSDREEDDTSHAGHLRSSISYPGAASGESFAAPSGAELRPGLHQSASDDSELNSSQGPMTIKVRYSNTIYGPKNYGDSDDENYMNCSTPRGLVFIANYAFSGTRGLEPRVGSERDVENFKELFTQMGYCVSDSHVHTDLDKLKTLEALRKFRDDPSHSEMHSSVIAIMSHGQGEGSFYTDDGLFIKTTDLLDLFNNTNCPGLAYKLKLFIFQFCRGVLQDRGGTKKVSLMLNYDEMQTDSAAQGYSRYVENLPTHSDQFCIYPCIEGYVSVRHPDRGTWLIEALCEVFMNHACDKDLYKLVQMISKKISANQSASGMKQSCECRARGVVKTFYFNPVNPRDFHTRCLAAAPTLSSSTAVFSPSATSSSSDVPGVSRFPFHFSGNAVRADEVIADEPPDACESRLVLEEMVKKLNLHDSNGVGARGDALPLPTSEELRKFRREVCSVELLPNNYSASSSLQSFEDAGSAHHSSLSLNRCMDHTLEISSSPSSGLGSISVSRLESNDSYFEGDLSSARHSISSGFSDEAFSLPSGIVREDSSVSLVASSRMDILRDLEDQTMDA